MPVPTFVGKSGADAVYQAIDKICKVNARYGPKLLLAIDAVEAATLITAPEATIARTFLTTLAASCAVFEKIAANSGFTV